MLGSTIGKLLVVWIVACIDPFGVVQWSGLHSYAIWQQIWAPAYPQYHVNFRGGVPGQESLGLRTVSIFYIDQQMKAWPPALTDQALRLEDMVDSADKDAPPKAIFLDFIFGGDLPEPPRMIRIAEAAQATSNPCDTSQAESAAPGQGGSRLTAFECYLVTVAKLTHYPMWAADVDCQANPLAKIACIRRTGGVPILFASPRDVTEDTEGKADPIPSSVVRDALGEVAILTPVGINAASYPLVSPTREQDRANHTFDLTPAAALYAAYCSAEPLDADNGCPTALKASLHAAYCSIDRGGCGKPPYSSQEAYCQRDLKLCERDSPDSDGAARPDWPRSMEAPIDIDWGQGWQDKFTTDILYKVTDHTLAHRCAVGGGGWLDPLWRSLGSLTSGLHAHDNPPKPCPYNHSLTYKDLDGDQLTPDMLRSMLDGKLVIMGARLLDSPDWVSTPINESVPGLNIHAMALDNLLDSGDGYSRDPPESLLGVNLGVNAGKCVEIATIAILTLFKRLRTVQQNTCEQRKLRGGAGKISILTHDVGIWLIFMGSSFLLMICALILNWTCHWSAPNFIGIGLAVVPLFPDGFSDWIERIFDHFRTHPLLKGVAEWCEIKDLTWDGPIQTEPETDAPRPPAEPGALAETFTETLSASIVAVETSTRPDHQHEPQGAA